MEESREILKRKEKGITLIALVITIIVLLILAGVSIAMLTGENGILTQAQRAKTETENAQEEEENRLNQYEDYINKATGVLTGGEWDETKGVNTPALKENMELVKWDDTSKSFVSDDTNSSYDYNNQQWANAKVTIDEVDSYFVWIPRYEYKITYNTPGTPSDGGTIDVKFIPTTQTEADEGYIIHPAFTNDSSNNYENGGWDSELAGIWVGKYETSLVNKETKENIVTTEEGDTSGNIIVDNNNNTDKAIAIQPNMSSWRWCTIGNMYTSARAYATNLNSHMLKNSEWGAVAYLTESQYGLNGTKIGKNTNSNYITANGNIETNVNQSSTGNVTGIYDLSGGAFEYVAAYYNDGNKNYLNNGSSLINEENKRYTGKYKGMTLNIDYVTGDATYETNGWHEEYGAFLSENRPFFARSGSITNSSYAVGVFFFDVNDGNAYFSGTFRMCLVVE